MSTDLMIPEVKDPQKVFVEGGTKPLVDAIKKIVDEQKLDVSTPTGRKHIASLAHSVARSKTYVDGIGKEMVAEIKIKAKVIDAERKRFRDTCDAIKAEVRAPLDEFEEAERQRVANLEKRVAEFASLSFETALPGSELDSETLKTNLNYVRQIEADESFEELQHEAVEAKSKAIERLETLIVEAEKREAEKAELERLQKQEEDRKQREREEQIRKEAQEKAEREAKEKAEADAKAKADAEERARKANKEHLKSVNCEALKALTSNGIDEEVAKQIITLIARNQVPNVTINY